MAKYLDKWKDLFPDTVGGTTRPSEAVSDQEEFNTDGFPQFIAQDPVNYALQNAFLKQFLSNDAWLWVKQKQANQALDDHKVDTQAHAKGISGNAGSATKLANARTIKLLGAVTADAASFDGTADATINVKTLDASKLKGTTSVSTTGNAATATKVVTNAAAGKSANIAEASMAGDDSARIRVSGAYNAGELALETADDGNEAIVARQYTGDFKDVARTASILDTNGNTSFPGTVVAPKFTGALNGNAATASKLASPRTLSLTGKATGSTTFDGSANASINVTNVNADTASKLSTARKINITGNATGAANFDGSGDVSINVSVNSAAKATNDKNGADIAATYLKKAGGTATGKITFNSTDLNALPEVKKTADDNMSGVRFSSKSKFLGAVGKRLSNGEDLLNLRSDNTTTDVVLDSRNYGSYALPQSGGTMSGALNFANSTWNLVGDDSYMGDHDISGTFCVKGANGETGIALCNKANDADYARISYGGGNINFNKTIGGNITGNAATATTATKADKLDGYHASDLFRHLGGNQTPVITDIFDRAGTIDMTTMSAADKATHKANINKAANAVQNCWNTDTGIKGYGGDFDIQNGYIRGTLKLTQSYKNFDKILVVGTEDHAGFTYYKLWDVWELANAFANNDCFKLITSTGNYWILVGTAKHGNVARKLSTDTIWSCQQQNSAIVAIYGIKY
ncbi:hypothetical protein [Mitsuokella multacida]|uniref:hypothetical protein n=1 Tax=Mitsuokella multacida TaxID=52226 RepID=UPI0026DC3A08|nr:hypothetical protein [Mitsuokella multacida]